MKYFVLIIISLVLLVSCKKECDTATADGAAFCWCEAVTDRLNYSLKGDSTGVLHARIRLEELHDEIGGHLNKGSYTVQEYEEELRNTPCGALAEEY